MAGKTRTGSGRGRNAAPDQAAVRAGQLLQQAVSQHRQGQLAQAEALYAELLRLQPGEPNALHLLGVLALQGKQAQRAVDLIGQALAHPLASAEMYLNHASALGELGDQEAALRSLEQAILRQPGLVEAHFRHAQALRKLQRHQAALESYARLLALDPDHAQALCSSGVLLKAIRRFAEALTYFDRALAIQPENVFAHAERAQTLLELNRLDEALLAYDRGLSYAPGHAEISAQKSLLLLLKGDFAQGWPLYEARWRCDSFAFNRRHLTQPQWSGAEALAGKTILLHAEQGLGDTIQFVRYVPVLAGRGARVLLEVQPALVGLLAGLAGVAGVCSKGAPLPHFDYFCPLMSLPAALRTTEAGIPGAAGYLTAPAWKLPVWQQRLEPASGLRVGLVWSGGTRHSNDGRRSIPLSRLLDFLPAAHQYVSLQKDLRAGDAEMLACHPHIQHFGSELHDFGDTAALIAQLDAVISVDTSVGHLSAALRCPTLMLLPFQPDWRWQLERCDSPWYASMQLCRQTTPEDWTTPLQTLALRLRQLAETAPVQARRR